MKRTIRGNRFRDSFGLGMLDVIPSAGTIPPPAIIRDGNTVAWYISNVLGAKGVVKDGADRVSRWNDFLGSGHDLIQATGADQGLWSLANGVLFDGVSEFMQATFTYDQPEQIYIVFRQVTWTSNDVICDGSTVSSGILEQNAITPELIIWAGAISPVNNNLALNTFGIIRILFNGGASTFEINETGQWVGNAGATNMSGFTLGSSSTGLDFSNIQVKEIILRKIADTSGNKQDIYNYLANKYGI